MGYFRDWWKAAGGIFCVSVVVLTVRRVIQGGIEPFSCCVFYGVARVVNNILCFCHDAARVKMDCLPLRVRNSSKKWVPTV